MRDEALPTVTAICRALSEQIGHGLLPAGGKLPAERKLSELFATTRITLREALIQLESQGLIYREERRGWFVSPSGWPTTRWSAVTSMRWSANRAGCRRPRFCRPGRCRRARRSASCWSCRRCPAFYQIRRARRVDGRLVLYVEHYLNAQYFPGILGHDLTRSLTELYASEYGIHYGRVRFDMVPTALHAEAAAPLKVAVGSPALRISRINRDQRGRLIDCDLEFWRHDAIHISVEVPQ